MRTLKLSDLLHACVVDEDGREIGRVHEVRCRRAGDPEPSQAPPYEVEGLIVGPGGLKLRLGLNPGKAPDPVDAASFVAWPDVVDVQPGRVVTRRGAGPR